MNIPVRIVEGYGINHVPVALQGVQLLSRCSVPHLACPIITSCDEANVENVSTLHGESDRHCAPRYLPGFCVLFFVSFPHWIITPFLIIGMPFSTGNHTFKTKDSFQTKPLT